MSAARSRAQARHTTHVAGNGHLLPRLLTKERQQGPDSTSYGPRKPGPLTADTTPGGGLKGAAESGQWRILDLLRLRLWRLAGHHRSRLDASDHQWPSGTAF